jgi:LPS sulfotransferase NodH
MNPSSPFNRPDALDLLGPEFDTVPREPVSRTLIICTAPRTGSYELCRHLIAAGIGVPHEYFHPGLAGRIGLRWGLGLQPLVESNLAGYLDTLRRRRAQGGVFAVKLMFYQFNENLRNSHGTALFEGAQVVHLYRPDVAGQYASLRIALQSGIWDFSDRRVDQAFFSSERKRSGETAFDQAIRILDFLIDEDAEFRRLFALLGIRPLFVHSDELFQNPRSVVRRIAERLDVPLNEAGLEQSIAHGGAYRRESKGQRTIADFAAQFKEIAFKKR